MRAPLHKYQGENHDNCNADGRHEAEVVVIPVSDVDRAKRFYSNLVGGSTPTSPPVTTSA